MSLRAAAVVAAALLWTGCGSGPNGQAGQWIRGRGISVRVTIAMPTPYQRSQTPQIEIRNDSGARVEVSTIEVHGWWDHSGERTAEFTLSENGRPARLEHGQDLLLPSGLWRPGLKSARVFITGGAAPSRAIALKPDSLTLPNSGDTLRRVRVAVAGERFTASR